MLFNHSSKFLSSLLPSRHLRSSSFFFFFPSSSFFFFPFPSFSFFPIPLPFIFGLLVASPSTVLHLVPRSSTLNDHLLSFTLLLTLFYSLSLSYLLSLLSISPTFTLSANFLLTHLLTLFLIHYLLLSLCFSLCLFLSIAISTYVLLKFSSDSDVWLCPQLYSLEKQATGCLN